MKYIGIIIVKHYLGNIVSHIAYIVGSVLDTAHGAVDTENQTGKSKNPEELK